MKNHQASFSANGGSGNKLTVTAIDNHIYFYSGIDSDRGLDLIGNLLDMDTALRIERESRKVPDDFPHIPIWLHINSQGGDVFSTFAIVDTIKRLKTPVYSIVEGLAASAASVVSVSCKKRYILPNSFMLIHQISTLEMGMVKHEDQKDDVRGVKMMMENMIKIYTENSKIDKKTISEWLKRDTWLNAKKALKYGFVDEIL